MTPSEFKAWFEGYAEGIEERPSAKQWERIKSRVSEIDGRQTTYNVFRDYYWSRPYPTTWTCEIGHLSAKSLCPMPTTNSALNNSISSSDPAHFNAMASFAALGRNDAASDA